MTKELIWGICIGAPIGVWLAALVVSLTLRRRDRSAPTVRPLLVVRGMSNSEMDNLNAQIRAQYNAQGERMHCSLGHSLEP